MHQVILVQDGDRSDGFDLLLLGVHVAQFSQGVLDVATELVLQENFVELLQVTVVDVETRREEGRTILNSVVLQADHGGKRHRGDVLCNALLRQDAVLEQGNLELDRAVCALELKLGSQPFNFVANVVEVLALCNFDVVLQEGVHDLPFFLWQLRLAYSSDLFV